MQRLRVEESDPQLQRLVTHQLAPFSSPMTTNGPYRRMRGVGRSRSLRQGTSIGTSHSGQDEKIAPLRGTVSRPQYVRLQSLCGSAAFSARAKHPLRFVCGDFNQNVRWDSSKSYTRSFQKVVDVLGEMGLASAWHRFHGELHGRELAPTLFFSRSQAMAYHIDYVFLPSYLDLTFVELCDFDPWVVEKRSDHVPLIADISLPPTSTSP